MQARQNDIDELKEPLLDVLNKPISRSFFKHGLFDRNLVPVIFDYLKEEKETVVINHATASRLA